VTVVSEIAARYPFTAVVGQDRLKLALILSAISPGIGGVLIRGEKGTAKSTIVRGLGPVAGGRVVELPIGATEDRVVGSLDLTGVLREGRADFTPGLLAQADGGVLYIDEVNLLADHLVDVLLDAAASGRVTIERDGVSHTQAAAFVLVGTMNPEEGELRPQLLDRFGLAVDVVAAHDVDERVEIISCRMEFDADPEAFAERHKAQEDELRTRIDDARAAVREVALPVAQLRRIAGICAHLGVDGLRGDIVVARAAAAHAAWRGAESIDGDDIAVAVELALPHRRRRDPFDDSGFTDEQLDDAMRAGDEAADSAEPEPDPDGDGPDDGGGARPESGADGDGPDLGDPAPDDATPDTPQQQPEQQTAPAGALFGTRSTGAPRRMRPLKVAGVGDGDPGRRSRARSTRGATTHAVDFTTGRPLHLFGTVLAAAGRTAGTTGTRVPGLTVVTDDLRGAQRVGREGNLVVFVVDLSGSMTARKRLAAVSELCVDLLRDSYTRRDRVAVVTARGSSAQVSVPPTRSVELAVRRLAQVRTGGRTPLAEGLQTATEVIDGAARREPARRPLLVVLTDGRATAGPDAPRRADAAAAGIARRGIASVVVDCEQGMIRLGMAHTLAARLGAQCLTLDELTPAALHRSGPHGPATAQVSRAS
jgi:magnesium chelatase subunit D